MEALTDDVKLSHTSALILKTIHAGYRYGWHERDVGFMLAGVGVCAAIVQAGLVQPVVRRFGERATLLAGLLFGASVRPTFEMPNVEIPGNAVCASDLG